MKYFFIALGVAFIVVISIVWAWYGIYKLNQHIKYKRLLKKYSRKNKGLKPWEKVISNNLPELIEDLKNRGN